MTKQDPMLTSHHFRMKSIADVTQLFYEVLLYGIIRKLTTTLFPVSDDVVIHDRNWRLPI